MRAAVTCARVAELREHVRLERKWWNTSAESYQRSYSIVLEGTISVVQCACVLILHGFSLHFTDALCTAFNDTCMRQKETKVYNEIERRVMGICTSPDRISTARLPS
jgi:hypothetical protein